MFVMPIASEVEVGWRTLHPNAIKRIQQLAYTTGKNVTDASMIIDT
jgi:hypothetical protein